MQFQILLYPRYRQRHPVHPQLTTSVETARYVYAISCCSTASLLVGSRGFPSYRDINPKQLHSTAELALIIISHYAHVSRVIRWRDGGWGCRGVRWFCGAQMDVNTPRACRTEPLKRGVRGMKISRPFRCHNNNNGSNRRV